MKVMMIKNSRIFFSIWLTAILILPSACGSTEQVTLKRNSEKQSQAIFRPEITSYKLSLEDEKKVLEVQFAQAEFGDLSLKVVKEKTCEKCMTQVEIISSEESKPYQLGKSEKIGLDEKNNLVGYDFVILNNITVEK